MDAGCDAPTSRHGSVDLLKGDDGVRATSVIRLTRALDTAVVACSLGYNEDDQVK